ncbi:MAG TPA: tyrosine-type recombinase/integrase [Allosphingosinicella sp.]|jgi:integrase
MALRFQILTRPAIRALQAGEKLQEHGIVVERRGSGDLRYSVNIQSDGNRVHRVIGRESEGVTREQAERAIEKFRTEAREGRLDLPRGRKRHRTTAEAADEYLERMEEGGGKNLRNKRRHLKSRLVPFLGKERLDKLTEFRLLQYRKHRQGEGAKLATVNRELATLSHMLNRAASKEWRWIKAEDVPTIPRAQEERKHIDILTPQEDDALLKAAVADQDPDIWLFVMFASNVAMRHTEITRRRFDEVDWQSCRIGIPQAKAGARLQPITIALRDALLKRREMADDPDGWIFPARTKLNKLPHRQSMAKQFRRVVIRAGMSAKGSKAVTPHTLRHTGISRLLMAGTDLKTAQTISGHKTVAMLMHYAHVLAPHVDQAITILNRGIPDANAPSLHTPSNEGNSEGGSVVPISVGNSAA